MNFEEYRSLERRYHPVILLLDVSASMKGEPIRALHDAVGVMVDTFAKEVTRERMITVAIITFGADGAVVHTSLLLYWSLTAILQAGGKKH